MIRLLLRLLGGGCKGQVASASYHQPGGFLLAPELKTGKGKTMHPTSRFGSKMAALVAALLLVGAAGAQEAKPAAPAAGPQVQKMTIYNGFVPTVSYSVQGGSPRLEALCQTLEFTENEINVTKELQKLRLEMVANEQTLDMVRTSQQLGLGPISTPGYAGCYGPPGSALTSALVPGLACEATPAMAYELINMREQVQNELLAEQARAAAVVHGEPPARPNVQPPAPVAAPAAVPKPKAPAPGPAAAPPAVPVRPPAHAVPQRLPMPLNPAAFQQMVRQNQERVRQQIMQTQQQIMQRHQEIMQMHG